MKKLILLFITLNSLFVCSQIKKDSILYDLRRESITSKIKLRKPNTKDYYVYQLCERWSDKLEYLKSNLTHSEIERIKKDDNASLSIIGLLCELEKNNTKHKAVEMIKTLIKSPIKFINYGCSDAISTTTISSFFLHLITEENSFFRPNFNLKIKEIRYLHEEIILAENNFWGNNSR